MLRRAPRASAFDLEPHVRRAFVDAPSEVGERLHEMKPPAADLVSGPVARDGDEADALVDDLGAQPARTFGLDLQAQRRRRRTSSTELVISSETSRLTSGMTSSATLPESPSMARRAAGRHGIAGYVSTESHPYSEGRLDRLRGRYSICGS